jgi:ATP-dependent Lhr-like helicase
VAGEHTLILAPTGSGKTLAAFLWGIDRLVTSPPVTDRSRRTRVLYISPLRALAVDVEKNLRAPLVGVRLAAERLAAEQGETAEVHEPTVAIRSGDTPADERRRQLRNPPDLLITTPESLYLLLTSAARDTLLGVEAVIIDEIHAMAGTKRGAHLALTLERLEARADSPPQRIGLSATQRPLDEIARFLGGHESSGAPRPVRVVDAGSRKELDVEVIVPVDDMGDLSAGAPSPTPEAAPGAPRHSIWPALHPRLLEAVQEHRSTLVFVNARRSAERLATRLNELATTGQSLGAENVGTPPALATDLVRAHHGSISREQRLVIEDDLKSGRVRGLVATSSLELGIDMGAVDLVVQVGSPGAVSRGLQRVGRAGHQVGEPSRGKVFPSHRSDLLEVATIVPRMKAGLVEETRVPRNPLDVLAQQIVAMVALDEWEVDELAALVRRAAPFHEVPDEVLTAVLDLLGGRYPSEQFAELRPRLVWDRLAGTLRARAGAQRLAVTNGGTIPDRGLYGVFLPDGKRVGELDEEMVYESRPGETFLLGASTWRIDEITHDRVVVVPAPGLPGKMPFWHGDGPGRPVELGRAMGELVRTLRSQPVEEASGRLRQEAGFDELAVSNLLLYLSDQEAATGVVPDDRTIVVERFRDEIGDWRVCVLSPFGSQVHAPWAMALRHRLAELWEVDVDVLWSDDGLAIRLPEAVDQLPLDELTIDPEELRDIVVAALPSTPMFAARFREASARALLIPRRRPGQRTPLWQQRQRSSDLLSVASAHPTFPMLLEATRECLHDVFDLPSLQELLRDLRSRKVRLVAVDTPRASPWAQSLVFDWVAAHLYDGDAPLAERRVAALTLDRELLAELLGAEELRELLDPEVLADLEAELQRRAGPFHPARDADAVHDLLRVLGPLTGAEVTERSGPDVAAWLDELRAAHRVIDVSVAGEDRVAAAEDAARLRDGLGVAIPLGLLTAFTDPVPTPLADLVARYARTHGPFLAAEVATRLGVDPHRVDGELADLEVAGRVVRGEFRPGGVSREWCDTEVLQRLRRRSLASLRREVEPVEADAFARFLTAWQGLDVPRRGVDGLVEVITSLQGAAIPASVLEAEVLPARVSGFRGADLDALCAAGEVVWVGAGALGSNNGRVRLFFRDQAPALVAALSSGGEVDRPDGPLHDALRARLWARGASFWPDLVAACAEAGLAYDEPTVLAALWDLVWAGEVTNDTLAPLRSHLSGRASSRPATRGAARPRPGRLARIGPPAGAGRWSLVSTLLAPAGDAPPPTPTEAAHALAWQLLERHGVVTREAVLAEGVPGGYAAVYPVLRALEERGQVRRGYFVSGLGAAQFALPGAVDRLRSARDEREERPPIVLAATDPAQPYGAALAWPEPAGGGHLARAAGARVLLLGGRPLGFLERGARRLVTFVSRDDEPEQVAARNHTLVAALASLVSTGSVRSIEVSHVDALPVREAPLAADLRAAGFVDGYRGLVLRA